MTEKVGRPFSSKIGKISTPINTCPQNPIRANKEMNPVKPNSAIPERLIEHRNATLDVYSRLSEALSKAGKTIPETVVRSHNNLAENQFLLAIIGKVKAGKSTFINALLEKEILPTDALQATSAVIEIFHAENPFVRVTYANGTSDKIDSSERDENLAPLRDKLRKVAAIQNEDRNLPIAQLNDFIIENFNTASNRAEWEPEILDNFVQSDLPNIHNIDRDKFQQLSREYLEHHRDGKSVVVRIEVGYPNAYQFDYFRIVDTPGICAKGGFAERTLDFLNKADGVIYLHKESPEEITLHDALQNVIPEKAKKHMFLVLTHKQQRIQDDNLAYLSEVEKCCAQIAKDRIFNVDSLTEIILQTVYGKDIIEIKDICKENEKWWKCIAELYLDAENSTAKFFELLEQQSNMRTLRQEIRRISEKSLGIQIETVLNAIQELYAELETDAAVRRDLYGERLKDPQQFAVEMSRQMEEMDELHADSLERIATIEREFNLESQNQKFGSALYKIIEDASTEINGKEFDSSDTAKTADNFLTKINQDVEDSLQDLLDEIKLAFQQTISDMEASLQAAFDITVPKIPLTELLEQLRTEATERVTVTVKKNDRWSRFKQFISPESWEWGTFKKEEHRLDAKSYFSASKATFRKKLWEKKQSVADAVKTNIKRICNEYCASVDRKLNERRQLFEDLKSKKQANDALQESVEEASKLVEAAKREIKECERIRGSL
jgi:GTPase SAR1 family protein